MASTTAWPGATFIMAPLTSIAGLFGWVFPIGWTRPTPGPRAAEGTILQRTSLQKRQRELALNLRRERETPDRLKENPRLWPHNAEKWIGLKVLGQGSYGTASLWEFVGDGSVEDDANPLLGKYVVLKTGHNHFSTAELYKEANFMKWLMKRNDSHIIRLVYNFEETLFDKIYMEYCAYGDMACEIRERWRLRHPWTEKELWKMFYCLAKACQTMAKTDASHYAFLHMDIKPQNTFLHKAGTPDHECPGGFVQFKIGDFGLAYEEKFPAFYSKHWTPGVVGRGTPMYKAPEQWARGLQFGEKLNIWGIGTLMFQAILLSNKPPPGPRPIVRGVRQTISYDMFRSPFGSDLIPALGKGDKYGRELEEGEEARRYTELLIATVLHCLMHNPKHRSSSSELVSRISDHIQKTYGASDLEYETARAEKQKTKQNAKEQEEIKAEDERVQAETPTAALIRRSKSEATLVEKERERAIENEIREAIECERERHLIANPPALWEQKMLTGDHDTTYWVNTKTGFPSWDDPYEDPPKSRTNCAGKVRDLLEQSPMEQMWVEWYEEFQSDWRSVFRRIDTGEVVYDEPDICRQWRAYWRAYWIKEYSFPRLELPPKPERMERESLIKSGRKWLKYRPLIKSR